MGLGLRRKMIIHGPQPHSWHQLIIDTVNKCIRDDTKGAARRSPNCIRKTKNSTKSRYVFHYWNSAKNYFLTQHFTEIGQSAAQLWPKMISKMAAIRHLEFWQFSYSIMRLSSNFNSAFVYQISSKSDNLSLRYGDFTIFKMTDVRHLEFLRSDNEKPM